MLKKPIQLLTIIILALLATACSALGQKPQPTPTPVAGDAFKPLVNATGVVVPAQDTTLSLTSGGVIAELLVEENDLVSAGQAILRLEGKEDLQAAAAAARLEVASAQYAIDQLYKDLDLRLAQAEQAVVDARKALRDAERRQVNVALSAEQVDVDQARANVTLARDKMEDAREDFEPYENKPENNLTRAALLSVKAQAEKDYEQAVRLLNNLLAGANDLDVTEAGAELAVAQAQLSVAQREVEILKQGPDPKDVNLAQERLSNAKAQLMAADAALHDLDLLAPFDGTVSVLYIKQGEYVAPGQVVLQLADLSHLRVETTDLNEIDVARLDVGNPVIVTFDALPEVSVGGKVIRIAPKASAGSGVNYTVLVELDKIHPKLRWGMTAFVDIEVSQ